MKKPDDPKKLRKPIKPLATNHDGNTLESAVKRVNWNSNLTAAELENRPLARNQIRDVLVKMGLRECKAMEGCGIYSLILEAPNRQLIRISPRNGKHKLRDYCLQPLHKIIAGDYEIEILPKIIPGGKESMVEALFKEAARDGYLFWDANVRNIGTLDDGTPVIIDRDSLVSLQKMHVFNRDTNTTYYDYFTCQRGVQVPTKYKSEDAIRTIAKSERTHPYLWHTAQQEHCKKNGLEYGKLNGVFSERDVLKLRKTLTGKQAGERESLITQIILEGRHDRESFGDIAEKATLDFGKGEHNSWTDALEAAHKKDMELRKR
jgi:hypothetical protein